MRSEEGVMVERARERETCRLRGRFDPGCLAGYVGCICSVFGADTRHRRISSVTWLVTSFLTPSASRCRHHGGLEKTQH